MSCQLCTFYDKAVVIIGAGISGLSCAFQLKKFGFKNVTILEARSRVGGRIQTIEFGSHMLDLGAQWIHGEKENVIYDIALQNELVDEHAVKYEQQLFSWSNIEIEEEKSAVFETIDFLERKICELQEKNSDVPESTIFGYLKNNFDSHLHQDGNKLSLQHIRKAAFDWYLKYQCELNGCEHLDTVSTHLAHHYRECEGSPLVELKSGYSSVIDVLLKGIPSEWVLMGKNVCRIKWLATDEELSEYESKEDCKHKYASCKPAKLICDDGTDFIADHVVVTIPLGCLNAMSESMFCPPLPLHKTKAIQCIGFGVVNKVYLQYAKPFWKENFILNVLWDTDLQYETHSSAEKDKDFREWYEDINRFSYVPHQPDVLCAWVIGRGAFLMETLSMEKVILDCHELLKAKLRKKNLPHPCYAVRSNWKSDPFSQGSYSYLSVACKEANISNLDLAQPVCTETRFGKHPTLLFAGEATHPHYFSTVHGAYETGIREADRIFYHYHLKTLLK